MSHAGLVYPKQEGGQRRVFLIWLARKENISKKP
jgi:hypothetical protein